MLKLAGFLDRRFIAPDPWRIEFADFDVLTWGRRTRFIGLVFEGEVIALDWKALSAFRVRIENICALAPRAYLHRFNKEKPAPLHRDYLRSYLATSRDNPFGVWTVMQALAGPPVERVTEYPPLSYPKDGQRAAVDRLKALSQIGDLVFTYDRSSGLSSLIRRLDWGMWSHVGMVAEGSVIHEMTTGGQVRSPFERLYSPTLDVGLYRIGDGPSLEQRQQLMQYMAEEISRPTRYAWCRVIRIALQKNLAIPYRRGPAELTSADMMYGNEFRLIGYA